MSGESWLAWGCPAGFGILMLVIILLVGYIRQHLHVEEKLAESENRFRSLADDALAGIYIIQDEFFRYVNPKMAEIFGYTVDELVDKIPPRLLVFDEDWPIVRDNLRKRMIGEERSIHYEFRGVTKNKEIVFIEVFGSRTIIRGKPAVIGTLLDITDRKRSEMALRESERKFRAIFDQTYQFIGLLAVDGTLIQANKAALAFSEVEESEVVGKPFWETVWWAHSAQEREKLRTGIAKAVQGEFVRFETTHVAANGDLHYIDFSLKPVKYNGKVTLVIPEGRDITERKEMERLKDEMVSAVSHEMRTPLTALVGFTDLLLQDEIDPQQRKEYLTIIRNETERLSALIGNFLDLQWLKARGEVFNWQPLNIWMILQESAGHFRPVSQRHHITVDCPQDLPQVRGHWRFLRQALDNIVSNAIKYSPNGGEVELRAWCEGNEVVIAVRDEGIGIEADAQEKIFDTFYRVDNTDRRATGGTGLGLSLVREIITIHRGSIRVESAVGKGSTFFIKLPIERS